MIAPSTRLVLNLQIQLVYEHTNTWMMMAFLGETFPHRHVHFMADQSESQDVQFLQHFQQPLKPVFPIKLVVLLENNGNWSLGWTMWGGCLFCWCIGGRCSSIASCSTFGKQLSLIILPPCVTLFNPIGCKMWFNVELNFASIRPFLIKDSVNKDVLSYLTLYSELFFNSIKSSPSPEHLTESTQAVHPVLILLCPPSNLFFKLLW